MSTKYKLRPVGARHLRHRSQYLLHVTLPDGSPPGHPADGPGNVGDGRRHTQELQLCCKQQGNNSTQPFCRHPTTPEVIRQFMLYDVVAQFHTPYFVL